MTSKERTILTTTRDCPGHLVPVGDSVTIPAATFVTLVQSLGGSYAVTHQGNMIRVDGTDADALGLEPIRLEFNPRPDGQIDETQVWEACTTCMTRIPVDIVNLGLVYKVAISQAEGSVEIDMTLTAPGCGMGPVLVGDVEVRLALVPNVKKVSVDLVLDPPWSREMMSEEAQLETGMFF